MKAPLNIHVILYAVFGYEYSFLMLLGIGIYRINESQILCGSMVLTAAALVIYLFFSTLIKPVAKGEL